MTKDLLSVCDMYLQLLALLFDVDLNVFHYILSFRLVLLGIVAINKIIGGLYFASVFKFHETNVGITF